MFIEKVSENDSINVENQIIRPVLPLVPCDVMTEPDPNRGLCILFDALCSINEEYHND